MMEREPAGRGNQRGEREVGGRGGRGLFVLPLAAVFSFDFSFSVYFSAHDLFSPFLSPSIHVE